MTLTENKAEGGPCTQMYTFKDLIIVLWIVKE